MSLRAWALLLILACGFSAIGCGDDSGSDDESSRPRAGMSGGGAGTGSTKITADQAITGACDMQKELLECDGLDDVTDCVLNDCGLQPCLNAACKDYQTCIENADDPCMNDCERSAACETCVADIADCTIEMCIEKLRCD
jgi:hypothetical protein